MTRLLDRLDDVLRTEIVHADDQRFRGPGEKAAQLGPARIGADMCDHAHLGLHPRQLGGRRRFVGDFRRERVDVERKRLGRRESLLRQHQFRNGRPGHLHLETAEGGGKLLHLGRIELGDALLLANGHHQRALVGNAPIPEHIAEAHPRHVRPVLLERHLRSGEDFLWIAVLQPRWCCRWSADHCRGRCRERRRRRNARHGRRGGGSSRCPRNIYRDGQRDGPYRRAILSDECRRSAFSRRRRQRGYQRRRYQRPRVRPAHEHAVEQIALRRIRYPVAEILDDAADAHAFVRDPLDSILAHLRPPRLAVHRHNATIRRLIRNARMMQREDFPTVIVHGRSRRAGCGVALVMDEIRQDIDDLVLAQAHLLRLAAWVLDDVAPLRGDRFSFVLR